MAGTLDLHHLIVYLFLIGLLVFSEVRNYLERKNLLDRLMSRDFVDFVSGENERKKATINIPKRLKGLEL